MDAKRYAAKAHKTQRYGEHPYTVHLHTVASITATDPEGDEAAIAVAWLHDVIEDTPATHEEIERRFGQLVATAVSYVTDPEGPSRQARKDALHQRLQKLDENDPAARKALLVKAADRLANARSSSQHLPALHEKYRREHPAFLKAAYRPGLAESIWAELNRIFGQ